MKYSHNRLLDTLAGKQTDQIPVWLMRQAGRHLPKYRKLRTQESDFLRFVSNPELTTAAALEPIETYDLDAAILFSDILTVPYWLGWPVTFKTGYGIDIPKISQSDLTKLSLKRFEDHTHITHNTMSSLRKTITDRPIIGFTGAPWTLSCYLLDRSQNGFTNARSTIYQNPAFLNQLMQLLTDAICLHIDTQVNAGADVIMLFDSWAGLLNPLEFASHCQPYLEAILEHIHSHNVPSILFAKGQSYDTQKQSQATCITLDWIQTLPTYASKVIQGNFDPALLLTDPSCIKEHVNRKFSNHSKSNYIGNLGHGILPSTPVDNVKAFVDALRSQSMKQQWEQNS